MKLDIFTLFPEAFDWFRSQRSVQNALARGQRAAASSTTARRRRWAPGRSTTRPTGAAPEWCSGSTSSTPRCEAAYPSGETPRVVLLSPTGRLLDDELADELTAEPHLALLCGRYEGFDERVHEHLADDEVSIGRYVLAGGELPAMVARRRRDAQAAGRARPRATRAVEESFSRVLEGMPEYPHYTRPAVLSGLGGARGAASPATTRGSASGGSSRAVRAEQFEPEWSIPQPRELGTIPQPRGA